MYFARMDGALLGSIDIAINRAFTAASFKLSTKDPAEITQPVQPLLGIHTTNGGRIVVFAWGSPLGRDREVVEAVGVSGGTVEHDQAIAEAGAAVL